MPVARNSLPRYWNVGNLLEHLGGIDVRRIRLFPPPGQATSEDVTRIDEEENRRCELIDGILVEKCMGLQESMFAMELGGRLRDFAREHNLGVVAAPDGAVELAPGVIRSPDVEFFAWEQFPGRKMPRKKIPPLPPFLAVEVLSEGNTPREMDRKLKDYFFAGVKLVWYIDPRKKTVRVFSAPDESRLLRERDTLDGGNILPGFLLPLREFFAAVPEYEADDTPPATKKKRR